MLLIYTKKDGFRDVTLEDQIPEPVRVLHGHGVKTGVEWIGEEKV